MVAAALWHREGVPAACVAPVYTACRGWCSTTAAPVGQFAVRLGKRLNSIWKLSQARQSVDLCGSADPQ
jgi:hypothetical protein